MTAVLKTLFACVGCAFVLYVLVSAILDGRNWLVLLRAQGNLTQTEQLFRVRIGDDAHLANRALQEAGFTYVSTLSESDPTKCLGKTADGETAIWSYMDFGWRRGVVCLAVHDERVEAMEWSFVPLAP